MPIFRRKRNGKYVGGWVTRVEGREVNLGTKDAKLARSREKLAMVGEWPRDPKEDAHEAAADVAAAMEGKSKRIAKEKGGRPASAEESPSTRENTAPRASTAAIPGSKPAASGTEPESMSDAMNAAASDATAEEIDEMAAAMGQTGEEFRDELAKMAESAPDAIAGVLLAGQAALAKLVCYLGTKGKKRIEIPQLPSGDPPRSVLAVGCKMAIKRIGWDFTRVPWWGVLLTGITLCLHAQLSNARIVIKAEAVSTNPPPNEAKAA